MSLIVIVIVIVYWGLSMFGYYGPVITNLTAGITDNYRYKSI